MSNDTKAIEKGAGASAPAVSGRRFFEIYKRGQGYYTRMGTVVGGAIIILAGMNYLWSQLGVIYDTSKIWTLYVRVGIPLVFGVGLGLLLFWVAGTSRRCCDFFIATEGEMKKVSWSTKREVVGSTKVVILFTVLLAVILFMVDILFLLFFSAIRVVKVPPEVLRRIMGGIFGMD
jgi:preprotein translocase SecE subunit